MKRFSLVDDARPLPRSDCGVGLPRQYSHKMIGTYQLCNSIQYQDADTAYCSRIAAADGLRPMCQEQIMKTVLALSAIVITGLVATATAQVVQGTNARERLAAMRIQNPASFDTCHSLAVQRGYSVRDEDGDVMALMHFISGCLMGQQR